MTDPDRRTGHIITDCQPYGPRWTAHYDADDRYPGYGFGATRQEACEQLKALDREWIQNGRGDI